MIFFKKHLLKRFRTWKFLLSIVFSTSLPTCWAQNADIPAQKPSDAKTSEGMRVLLFNEHKICAQKLDSFKVYRQKLPEDRRVKTTSLEEILTKKDFDEIIGQIFNQSKNQFSKTMKMIKETPSGSFTKEKIDEISEAIGIYSGNCHRNIEAYKKIIDNQEKKYKLQDSKRRRGTIF